MDSTQEFKFGEKVLPGRRSPADAAEVGIELADDLLEATKSQRTEVLNGWAKGSQPAETSKVAGRYLDRHRWRRVGNSWVDDYDTADLQQRAEFIGKPAVRDLQRQIALANLELQHTALARAQQEPGSQADLAVAEAQAGLQQRLLQLAAQFEAAVEEMQQKAQEWDSQPHPPPAETPAAETTAATTPLPSSSSQTPHTSSSSLGGGLADSGIGAAAAGLLCGVGFTHFGPRLFQKDKSFGRSLLGFGVVTLATAVALLSPARAKVRRQRVPRPANGGVHVNVLAVGSTEEEEEAEEE